MMVSPFVLFTIPYPVVVFACQDYGKVVSKMQPNGSQMWLVMVASAHNFNDQSSSTACFLG